MFHSISLICSFVYVLKLTETLVNWYEWIPSWFLNRRMIPLQMIGLKVSCLGRMSIFILNLSVILEDNLPIISLQAWQKAMLHSIDPYVWIVTFSSLLQLFITSYIVRWTKKQEMLLYLLLFRYYNMDSIKFENI